MSSRPLSDRARTGACGGGHAVPVVRAEHHQEVLRRLPLGRTVAELAFCTVTAGEFRGSRCTEVRLGGVRVGELTFRTSERYADLVRPGARCPATVEDGRLGREVTVWLPARREPGVDSVGEGFVEGCGEGFGEPATDRFTAVVVPLQREEPPTERVPVVPPAPSDGLLVVLPEPEQDRIPDPAPPRTEQPSRSTPLVVPGQRGPQRSPRCGRTRRPLLIAGASVATALIGLTAVTGVVSAVNSADPTPAPAVVVSSVAPSAADAPQSPAQTPPR